MTAPRTISLAELERMIDDDFRLEAVDSTEDQLILELAKDGTQQRVGLDRASARELTPSPLLDRLVATARASPIALVA